MAGETDRTRVVRDLFVQHVPEIASGVIVIEAIACEPGVRSKIAVRSETDPDPVATCVGGRDATIMKQITARLHPEKLDIVRWNANPELFIGNALKPVQVESVSLDHSARIAHVVVSIDDHQRLTRRQPELLPLACVLSRWEIRVG